MENTNELHMTRSGFLPFDPIVLVLDVARRWLLILLAALTVGIGAYIVTDACYEPVYQARTTFVVTSRSSASSVYSNLTSTTGLASVFTEVLNSSLLRKAILAEIGSSSFDGSINAAVIPETNLLTVTVTASDPRTAFLVAQAVIDHHDTVTYQVVDGIALEVLQYPTVPTAPTNRANAMDQLKDMAVLAALGMAALVAALSFVRNAVRSSEEARNKLDCNCLGEIPHENKYKTLGARIRNRKTSILITNPTTSFRFVETVRKLRRRVEQRMRGGKVLMVTSLLENEGKSTVAVNLALALAQKHEKVLLIDCDLRKPACHTLLEQTQIPHAVRDVLAGKAAPGDAVLRDSRSGLSLLLEKQGSSSAGDLLSSHGMQSLLAWTRQEYNYVVLDLPPMTAGPDAESVTESADACLLVVRQNAALVPALNKAIATLEHGKAKLLGCVLNNVRSTRLSSGQGTGYGSYGKYGHYGRYGHYGHYGHSDADDTEQ